MPRAREQLELLSKTGASSRIIGGCRCDRAENAMRRLFCASRVYVPVGKTAPRTGEPTVLVRIIVRELLFHKVQCDSRYSRMCLWEVVRFLRLTYIKEAKSKMKDNRLGLRVSIICNKRYQQENI